MKITVEEFKNKLDYYLEKSQEEDIFITTNETLRVSLISPDKYEKYTGKIINKCI